MSTFAAMLNSIQLSFILSVTEVFHYLSRPLQMPKNCWHILTLDILKQKSNIIIHKSLEIACSNNQFILRYIWRTLTLLATIHFTLKPTIYIDSPQYFPDHLIIIKSIPLQSTLGYDLGKVSVMHSKFTR